MIIATTISLFLLCSCSTGYYANGVSEHDIKGVVWLVLIGCAILVGFAYVKMDGK